MLHICIFLFIFYSSFVEKLPGKKHVFSTNRYSFFPDIRYDIFIKNLLTNAYRKTREHWDVVEHNVQDIVPVHNNGLF